MRWCIDDWREDMHLRAHDAMRGRGFNSRRLRCGRSTWVTAARHPASTIIFDGPAGLQIARYIAVEPGTRRILRCSPEWLETARTGLHTAIISTAIPGHLARRRPRNVNARKTNAVGGPAAAGSAQRRIEPQAAATGRCMSRPAPRAASDWRAA
jgi:hypothetical protein